MGEMPGGGLKIDIMLFFYGRWHKLCVTLSLALSRMDISHSMATLRIQDMFRGLIRIQRMPKAS